MTIKNFKVRGYHYQFRVQADFWGYNEVALLQNGQRIGYLNKNCTLENAESVIKASAEFKEYGVVI
ncbi:hypothetical protein IF721_13560 (plasmid) [Staphylococcus aureus]|uniref:hypothetical protein n=1 Tax=Staphylococcus aureus TaxID=1280 RepID=UPI000BA681D4|nr:hypothetical protein [Staphylococcus aureus]EHS7180683.1 hypothetical protein [Staphylococcus pseudintermedius]PAJ49892.1 hypothetical protein APW25_12050 [Staphylococcus aureus]ULW18153.1 hypothetical protein IF721_13560 [Staphylococcus aureus]BBL19083.1 hypothetical protein SAJRA307_P0350 [Staphylococcus aureus]HAR6425140.1 hypothetical protein [Staphylococcus pseudintermedius]